MSSRPAPYSALIAPEPEFATHAEVLAAPRATERLKAHALSALTAIAPATVAWFFTVDRRHRSTQAIVWEGDRFDTAPARMWHRYRASVGEADPFMARHVEPHGLTVVALKDFEPDCTALYRAHLAELNLVDRADIYLYNVGMVVAQFSLVRGPEHPPFGPADLVALRRLQPLLEHAFACTLDPELPELRSVLAENGLSEREMDVAELVARGATNSQIARTLHISEATVKTHLTRVYSKVGVRTRTQLALALGTDELAAPTTSG